MKLKTNYQYTYFIYPFAVKKEKYNKYISNLIKNRKYQIKFFDTFKNIELYKYFVPSVKEKMFQDFSFSDEKINEFRKLGKSQRLKLLKEQNCLIFDYILEEQIQGKTDEQEGIFFTIPKIELVCFNTGICFLLLKTHLEETENFADILNFNYKFENINLENKNLKKLKNIKIQTNIFNNMSEISKIIEEITGQKIESSKLDIDENLFLLYTYVCLEANYWSKESDFSAIENEFIKLAEVKPNDVNINIDYDKLTMLSNSSYRKIRINNKCVATICSSTDTENYTKFPYMYENQYLYTYIIALHQRYYLKKLNNEFKERSPYALNNFLDFSNNAWISEITTDSFGQKFYKRCKEKLNLQTLFDDLKIKYDIFYKELNIEKNKKINDLILAMLTGCLIVGFANFASWMFFK